MNRKAQFDLARKTIFWMIAGFLITITVLAVGYNLITYREKLTAVPAKVRAELLAMRFTNNPACFAPQDETTGRVYLNRIVLSKFTQAQLNQCYTTEVERGFKTFNFRLHLVNQNKELQTNNYFHKDDVTISKEVLVQTDVGLQKDILQIYVQERIGEAASR